MTSQHGVRSGLNTASPKCHPATKHHLLRSFQRNDYFVAALNRSNVLKSIHLNSSGMQEAIRRILPRINFDPAILTLVCG